VLVFTVVDLVLVCVSVAGLIVFVVEVCFVFAGVVGDDEVAISNVTTG
jgi:hypothetical protein